MLPRRLGAIADTEWSKGISAWVKVVLWEPPAQMNERDSPRQKQQLKQIARTAAQADQGVLAWRGFARRLLDPPVAKHRGRTLASRS